MRALIARTDHMGDMVLTTPLFRAMARAGWTLEVTAPRYVLPVLEGNPALAVTFALEDIAPDFPVRSRSLCRWIRERHYDAVIAPYARSSTLCRAIAFSGARYRIVMWGGVWARLLGIKALRSRLLTQPRHMSDIWLDCARELGVEPMGLEPEVFLTEQERNWACRKRQELSVDRPFLLVHPGCGGNTCNLSPVEYGQLVRRLLKETEADVVVTGSANELSLLREWPEEVRQSPRCQIMMGVWTLREFMAMISVCDLVVCVGTGPLHLASALHRPTVSPFCPLVGVSFQVWGNLGGRGQVICGVEKNCRKESPDRAMHCDFRGEISVDDLLAKIHHTLSF